jgi:hypothetical protein
MTTLTLNTVRTAVLTALYVLGSATAMAQPAARLGFPQASKTMAQALPKVEELARRKAPAPAIVRSFSN